MKDVYVLNLREFGEDDVQIYNIYEDEFEAEKEGKSFVADRNSLVVEYDVINYALIEKEETE